MQKNFKSIFNENTDQFSYAKNISSLHLMKYRLVFICKKIRSIFNENTNLIYM